MGATTLLDPQTLSEVLGRLYQSLLDDDEDWQGVLLTLEQCFDSPHAVLMRRESALIDPGLIYMGHREEGLDYQRYALGGYASDPFTSLPLGEVVALSDRIPERLLESSDFYRQCMAPYQIHHILGVDFAVADGEIAALRLTRAKTAPPFDRTDRQMLSWLVGHLQRILRLHRRGAQREQQNWLYQQTLARLQVGIVVTDSEREIHACNQAAEAILARGQGITQRQGRLQLLRASDRQAFAQRLDAMERALNEGGMPLAAAMSVLQEEDGQELTLILRPHSVPVGERPKITVLIVDPRRQRTLNEPLLQQLFELTPAQARLVLQLVQGQTLDEAAQELGIARNTARAHLRAIFSKTGVAQQTQLVSRVLGRVADL